MNDYRFEDISQGQTERLTRRITGEMMEDFRALTGDENPLHTDAEAARERGFKDRVSYGMLTASFLSTLAGVYLPGRYSLIQSVEIKFAKPVYIGDELTVSGEITEKNDTYGLIFLKVTITEGSGKKVCRGKMQIGVKMREEDDR